MNTRSVWHNISAAVTMMILMGLGGIMPFVRAQTRSAGAKTEQTLSAPGNDNFANAQLLSGSSGSVTGATSGATKETQEPSHARNRGGRPSGTNMWHPRRAQ
jgi:hypothetical protein